MVFTPSTPARATFVEREAINNKLVDALRTPGKQIVVYGYSGSGKTTLLVNKLHQLYENHITTRCFVGISFDQILLNGFDQLNKYYTTEMVQSRKQQISSSLQSQYLVIKAQVDAEISSDSQRKDVRITAPQLTPQTLAQFLGETNCCWVLEDFHKVEDKEKTKLSQVMKLFMDMADDYPQLKIISIGAVDTARQVIEYDREMRNRVSEIHVPLMEEDEIRQIIDKGEEALNFSLSPKVKESIVKYSNGLAAVCHQLCLNICFAADISQTLQTKLVISEDELKNAIELYLENASDTVKSVFDKAFRRVRKGKFDNGRLILETMVKIGAEGVTRSEILAEIKRKKPDYPSGNLTFYLSKFQSSERGFILRYDQASGKFSFTDPIYRVFAMSFFGKESNFETDQINVRELMDVLKRHLRSRSSNSTQQILPF